MNYEVKYIRDGSEFVKTVILSKEKYKRIKQIPWIKIVSVRKVHSNKTSDCLE